MKHLFRLLTPAYSRHCDTLICTCILFSQHLCKLCRIAHQLFPVFLFCQHGCLCLARNGIVLLSAAQRYQPKLSELSEFMEKSGQKQCGICPDLINLRSGMPSQKSIHLDIIADSCPLLIINRQLADTSHTACTACPEDSLLLGVQIDQVFSL